jgi:hypothetical protein
VLLRMEKVGWRVGSKSILCEMVVSNGWEVGNGSQVRRLLRLAREGDSPAVVLWLLVMDARVL